jgi:hypothetical protein
MKPHASITEERIVEACKRHMTTLDDPGFCLACGHEQDGCEPDARRYRCEACGEPQVYGAEELALLMIVIDYHTEEGGE